MWCIRDKEEVVKVKLALDPHSPHRLRVRGMVTHNPDFIKAFSCKDKGVANEWEKCDLW